MIDTLNITGGLIILASGVAALALSVSGLRKREYTMMNLGLFFAMYGIRWLIEVPGIADTVSSIFPRSMPYLHSFLTYMIPIPFSAFLVNVIGKGLYNSMRWFFATTILYAVFAMIYDLFSKSGPLTPSINIVVLIVWCMVGGMNIILMQDRQNVELRVLKTTLYIFFLCLAYDNLVVMEVLPWKFRMEHLDILVLFFGMVFIGVRRLRSSKVKPGLRG